MVNITLAGERLHMCNIAKRCGETKWINVVVVTTAEVPARLKLGNAGEVLIDSGEGPVELTVHDLNSIKAIKFSSSNVTAADTLELIHGHDDSDLVIMLKKIDPMKGVVDRAIGLFRSMTNDTIFLEKGGHIKPYILSEYNAVKMLTYADCLELLDSAERQCEYVDGGMKIVRKGAMV